jgi:uncharacterized protein YecT (DUF1311 family)
LIRHVTLGLALIAVPMGAAADPSLECSVGSGSQVETGDCLAQTEETVDAALDIILRFARDSATELDEVTGRNVALPALDKAQAAWEAYRDAQCDYAGALFGGGSGTGIEIRSCRIDVTRDRTQALEAALP